MSVRTMKVIHCDVCGRVIPEGEKWYSARAVAHCGSSAILASDRDLCAACATMAGLAPLPDPGK